MTKQRQTTNGRGGSGAGFAMRHASFIVFLCLWLASVFGANAQTNLLVWHRPTDRVDANVRGEAILPLLEQIAQQSGWHVFVEPDVLGHQSAAKFKNLPAADALRMLLGDLNFVIAPPTNGVTRLYVFHTAAKNAIRPVLAPRATPRYVPNELLVRVKPGTDIDALARALGAKITGRNDKLGLYRLLFDNPTATDTALTSLKNNSDVSAVDYDYIFDPPVTPQPLANVPAGLGPVSLTLNPPGDSGKTIVGLIDTPVQPLDGSLEQFLLKQLSVVDGAGTDSAGPTHGTAMAETILRALAAASGGSSSVQILPVDVYGSGETTTSWNVALGIQAAVDHGANVLNLSLAGTSDSAVLDSIIQQTLAAGIPVFAAAGNDATSAPTYPAAVKGVIAVTATQGSGLAPYANFGSYVAVALPGGNVIFLNGAAYVVQGTSVSTAYATGVAAGNKTSDTATWAQILAALQEKFPVPGK